MLPHVGIFRILICRTTHSLGNTLLLTPLLRELETVYPGAEIDIVTRTPIGIEIFRRFSNVRRVLSLPAHAFGSPLQFLRILRLTRNTRYDLVIDPSPRSRTGRKLLSGAIGTYKLGFAGYKDRVLTHRVPLPSAIRHTGQRAVHLLRSALGTSNEAFPSPDMCLSPTERREGRLTLARILESAGVRESKGVIGIFANATGAKLLPEAWWQTFLNALTARYPAHTVLEIIPAFGRSMLSSRYLTFYSTDIRRLGSVLGALTAFVSTDCGVMHLACASGVPVTGIFSATDAAEWGPYGRRDRAIDARGLSPSQVAEQVEVSLC